MEFPSLGQRCSHGSCNQLDFLPIKCDACKDVFCKDHVRYDVHRCSSAYKKDVQVPVCPLCNQPVPITRGETPDIKVGEHIDRFCQSDPAVANRKVYANRCSVKGCKKKELVPINCGSCRLNFCLRHRNEMDHDCTGFQNSGRPISSAGAAAAERTKKTPPAKSTTPKRTTAAPAANNAQMTEDEALALALQISLNDSADGAPPRAAAAASSGASPSSQEDEDRALAMALQESEREFATRHQRAEEHKKNCIVA